MKLGIISDCKHYTTPDGKIGTENHILLRQLETLCSHFDQTLICCPFLAYNENLVLSTYSSPNISFLPVDWGAGETWKERWDIVKGVPKWWRAFKQVDQFSDIVYQRLPNALNAVAFVYYWLRRKKVFATYTGTWHDHYRESASYTVQRWLLKTYFRGPVWVYWTNNEGNARLHPNYSPSYSQQEWAEENNNVAVRISNLHNGGLHHFRLITVGALTDYKNQVGIVKACKILKDQKLSFHLTIVGGGVKKKELEQLIIALGLQQQVRLVGKKNAEELRELYRQHDFVVQAPKYEGFGKVPIEGMFHGAIPVINNISMAFYITGGGERGFLFDSTKYENIAEALLSIQHRMHELPEMIERGREFTKTQTLESWAKEYYDTVSGYYKEA